MDRRPLHDALSEHQHEIGLMLDEAGKILQSSDPARAPAMMLLRYNLSKRLRSYQEFKHVLLFDPLCGAGKTAVGRLACQMRDRCTATGDAYGEHVGAWPDDDLDGMWAAYKVAATDMIATIREHLRLERQDAEQLFWARAWIGSASGGPSG